MTTTMGRVYRAMREAPDGYPEVGPSARTLGARPGTDIPVSAWGDVQPQTGGMSVSPDDPRHLPPHRRPPEYGGTGPDPVWGLDLADLPPALTYRPDPVAPQFHGFFEPSGPTALASYQQTLESTRPDWRQETGVSSPNGDDVSAQPVPAAFYQALDASDPVDALRTAVQDDVRATMESGLRNDDPGRSTDEYARRMAYGKLQTLREQLHAEHDDREDAVLDVMDFVWGWSSPHVRITG